MIVSPPAEIGMRLVEVDTPALLIDLDAFERNLKRLAERAMAQGGVGDVLVSNEIAGARKCARLAALAREARIAVCVDDPVHIAALSEAATAYGITLDVLVEINVGGNRCGVEPGAPALALVEGIAKAKGLRFRGLQAYHGSAQHIADYAKRRESVAGAIEKARETRDLLAKH